MEQSVFSKSEANEIIAEQRKEASQWQPDMTLLG